MANKSKGMTFRHEYNASVAGTPMLLTAESLLANHEWHEPTQEGMIGTSLPTKDGRILKKTDVKGSITVRPNIAQGKIILDTWFDVLAGVYTPAATPNSKTGAVVIDRKTGVWTYAACWLAALELSAKQNEPIDWLLELLGTTEVKTGTVAALTPPDRMRLADCVFTIGSDSYFPEGFKWRMSYEYDERFLNSLTRSVVQPKIPVMELDLDFDKNADTQAIRELAGTNTEVASVGFAISDGSHSLTWAHPGMTVMNPAAEEGGSGVEAVKNQLKLRAWLKSPATANGTITYA